MPMVLNLNFSLNPLLTSKDKGERKERHTAAQPTISYQETFVKKAEERTIKQAFNKPKEDFEIPSQEEVSKTREEEELDIPAFLRKKLNDR